MPKRSYGQFEGLATALDAVGERWTLLLVRELLLFSQRVRSDKLSSSGYAFRHPRLQDALWATLHQSNG